MTILMGVAWAILAVSDDAKPPEEPVWDYSAPISDAPQTQGFVRLPLAAAVFDATRPNLEDLRIADELDAMVPFVLFALPSPREAAWRDAEFVPTNSASLEDRQNAPGQSKFIYAFSADARADTIQVETLEVVARVRIRAETSLDGKEWMLAADPLWLVSMDADGRAFRADTWSFPETRLRYLRLTASSTARDATAPRLGRARIARRSLRPETGFVEVVPTSLAGPKSRPYGSSWDIDLGARNLPLVQLALDIGDAHFCRPFELVGRNEETVVTHRRTESGDRPETVEAPWLSIASGVLYRIQDSVGAESFRTNEDGTTAGQADIAYEGPGYRFLQLRVFDGDDNPLEIKAVSGLRRDLAAIFECDPAHTYRLLCGNAKVSAPRYDLARSVAALNVSDLPAVSAGPLAAIPHEPELAPWTERHGILIWICLGAAVLVGVGLLVVNLKRLRQET